MAPPVESGAAGGRLPGPDRGWSWTVAFAACFCSLVLSGIFRTSGVLFVAFIGAFGVTREEAAWPMVVCISVLNLTGPLSGLLGQRYGVRPVVMSGALIGAIGVSACFFTTSLSTITVLFGGVFGVGYGLVNTLWPVIVNMYFLNLRSTANGIANSGSCFGSVILPVLFEKLICAYGLPGCFLLTGAVVLNVAVAGALMRTPPWARNVTGDASKVQGPSSHSGGLVPEEEHLLDDGGVSGDCRIVASECASDRQRVDPHSELQVELGRTLDRRNTTLSSRDSQGLVYFPEESLESLGTSGSSVFERHNGMVHSVDYEIHRTDAGDFEDSLEETVDITGTSKSDDVLHRLDDDLLEAKTSELTGNCPARHSFSTSSAKRPPARFKSPIPSAGPLRKHTYKFSDSSGDFANFDLYPLSEGKKQADATPFDEADEDLVPQTSPSPTTPPQDRPPGPPSTAQSVRTVATSPLFYMTALANVSFYFLFHMFVNVIVDYALDRGVPEGDTKYILFAFSLFDLVGRLFFGWVTDRKFLTRSRFVSLGMAGISLTFFMFPLATRFSGLVVASSCYGLLLGCTMIIFPILLVEYLGIELLPVAYGYLCFLNGFASFSRPFIIGYFRDYAGSYENMFYILGSISLLASAVMILERLWLKKNDPLTVSAKETIHKHSDDPL